MQIDSFSEQKTESYSVLFNRCRLGFVSKINIEHLKLFSIPNQQRLGKIDVKFSINAIKGLPHNRNFHYLVMTEYQQIIPLIYLIRSQPSHCQILTTKSMLESAKIYAEDFYHVIKKINQVVSQPSYEQESQTYDNYEVQYQMDLNSWTGIFQKQEISQFVSKCVSLNYGQVFDSERGMLVTPYPSGINLGSAVWLLENIQTKHKCLWVQGMSHHNWRSCKQFEVNPIHNEINDIIFTRGALSNCSETVHDEQECLQFLKTIQQRLQRSFNTRIVIEDSLVIADIINYLAFQFKDKLKRIFFTGTSVNKLMSYANSYVEFLTPNHQRRIYEDPPVYPFDTYEQLRGKVIGQGTIEQISTEHKVPPKQLILRSTPFIQFEADYHAYLFEGENEVVQTMFGKYYSLSKLKGWLSGVKVNKITYFCKKDEELKNLHDLGHSFQLNLIGENIYLPCNNVFKHYITEGTIPRLISHYTKKNGWLKLNKIQQTFRKISINWSRLLSQALKKSGANVLESTQNSVETQLSKVWIDNYRIYVSTHNEQQLKLIQHQLNECSQLFKLG